MKILWRRYSNSQGCCVEAGAVAWKTASANSNSCVEVAQALDWVTASCASRECVEVAGAQDWASASTFNGDCVEATRVSAPPRAFQSPAVLVRDSKAPDGPVQPYTQDQWDTLTAGGWDSFRAVQAENTSWPDGKDGQATLFALDCPCGDGNALYFTEAEVKTFLDGVEAGAFATI